LGADHPHHRANLVVFGPVRFASLTVVIHPWTSFCTLNKYSHFGVRTICHRIVEKQAVVQIEREAVVLSAISTG
jgi:hypothetical protein